MKIKNTLHQLAILLGIFASIAGGHFLGHIFLVTAISPGSKYDGFGFPTLPPLTRLNVPSQTVDGITATIEGVYADPSRVVFIISFSSQVGNFQFDGTFLADAKGEQIGTSGGNLGLLPNETSTYLIAFHPVDWLNESRLDSQLSIAFTSSTDASQITKFLFDFELPVHPFVAFHPKKTITINGVDIFLDRVLVAPATTYIYLCYPNRSDENWILTGENITLNINQQVSNPNMPSPRLFDSTIIKGEQEQFSEPGWTPPNEESRCIKLGFPIGDAHPIFLTLTLPGLEDAMTTIVPEDKLSVAYETLLAQGVDMQWHSDEGGTFAEYRSLPEGMTEKEAYHRFMDALGYLREGPWVFRIFLIR
jgi:hypothetical protein